jgi:hypothetical protein
MSHELRDARERDSDMIILSGNGGGAEYREHVAKSDNMGILLSPSHSLAWCPIYACDNSMFAHRKDPGWWERQGEAPWLRMLDRVMEYRPRPMFVALPDVVYDWPRTLERAYRYRTEVTGREMTPALVLQDGATEREAILFDASVLFVGGSRHWKWEQLPIIRQWSYPAWLHVGRANGHRQLRYCEEIGVDSLDGTSFNRFWNGRRGGREMLEKADASKTTAQKRLL